MNMLFSFDEVKHATFEKCLDVICNMGFTPYMMVNINHKEYRGPVEQANENGVIVLGIGVNAVTGFLMNEEGLSFSYTQGTLAATAYVPMSCIMSIYAKEDRSVFQPFPHRKLEAVKEPEKAPKRHSFSGSAKLTRPQLRPTGAPVKKAWTPRLIKGDKT